MKRHNAQEKSTPAKQPLRPESTSSKKHLRTNRWHRLDNTANLFPVIVSRRFSNVYRISLHFTEPVVPELLQRALEKVLPWFPAFGVRMRRGFFWRYLETNPETPLVRLEDDYPCSYIDPGHNQNFLFRISYFEKRVNLEVFHALSDGTGALQFFQAVCCQYLMLVYPDAFTPQEKERQWFAQYASNTEDSYAANYTPTKKANYREGRAFRLKGERNPLDAVGAITLYIPSKPLVAFCRQKGVSITHYLTACVAWAVYTQKIGPNGAKHPVNIFMPVNLRNLFPSNTTLNFFSNIYVSLPFTGQNTVTFDDVLHNVQRQFEEKVTKENMLEKISYTVGSGYHPLVRAVPLPLKNIVLRAIFESSVGSSTMGLTNMGRVTVPPPFEPYVNGAVLMLSCAPREPLKVAVISYKDTLALTFTSLLRDVAIQREVARKMAQDGLDITVETNGVDYEEL